MAETAPDAVTGNLFGAAKRGLGALEVEMTDEPDEELGEIGVELESQELHLTDGECWIIDPECLDPDTESEGVIAVQYRDGGLYYMTGQTHKWVNAETQTKGKRGDVRVIRGEK